MTLLAIHILVFSGLCGSITLFLYAFVRIGWVLFWSARVSNRGLVRVVGVGECVYLRGSWLPINYEDLFL